jgi:hypothetical protein
VRAKERRIPLTEHSELSSGPEFRNTSESVADDKPESKMRA